ncbi:unnamed protein product [Ceratitis capitata]|uniref:(Mediterranean fruit fly) hypothetical protein n=1 Tax=Ceratitis capitata TaxID=7213 RepID=A0A811TZ11_CERCA|nr:unnamed protein product [Ceratitis capitata]
MASRRVKKSKSGEKKNTLSQKQKHQQSKAENYVETLESNGAPFVKIIEQPASRMVRFRYQCEGRSAAAVPGMSSTPRNKTYPEIEIVGYKGASVVVVSCVSKDAPYRPHPYNLIGREGCRRGVYTVANKTGTTRIKFCSLGVQCVKRTGVQASLKIRENIRVDPFKTGFEHATEAIFVDMTAVRLCFQVFIEDSSGRFTIPLKPVVSEPIYDSRAVADLKIYQMCSSSTALGDKPIILLCDKIIREKTMVRFYEEKGSDVIWQSYGDYRPSDIHRQTAIKLYPPQYHNLDITEPVQVYVQLVNVDGFASEPCPFKYMPIDSDEVLLKRKCKRIGLEIGTDSKKEHASRGDSFRNIVESWLKPNITRSLSTHSKEDVYTETSSSDETLESAYSSIPEVISDVISVRMATSEDSNDSVANQKLQTPAHQLPTNSIPNHQQQQASPSKSDYQHEYFQTKSSSMQQPQSASSPLSLGPKLSFIETPKPESLHLQQHHLKQTPPLHHENTPPRSHNLQHQHLSMKSAHKLPLQINSAQLQSSDHLPIESHGHELRQKQNLSISSPHQTEQSPQPLTVRFDSPQLQLSGHSTKESQAFKRSNNNLSMRSPHQPSPNEIQDLLEQLPLRFDSPQLQSPTGSQQQNLAEPSPQQPFRENPELRKQNQAMVLSQMQQHLPKQSPQHGNFATESHKLQQQHLSMKSSYSLPPGWT